jgi:hypothetical protein
MQTINLLPESEQKELRMQVIAEQVSSFWIWTLLSFVIFGAFSYFGQFTLKDQITQTERTINVRSAVLNSGENEKYKNEVETLNNNIKSFKALNKEHYQWSRVLEEIALILPSDVTLDSLILQRDTGKIDIVATAGERDSILSFWANVIKFPYFANINFPLSNLEKSTDVPFMFTFYLKPGKLTTGGIKQ